jgi:glycosyltransferase involved in cell wall biosynthesis
MPMNILFSKSSFAGPISGADEIVATYAIELKKAGHQTSVLLIHSPVAGDSQAVRLQSAEVPVSILASPAFSMSLIMGRKIARQLMGIFSPTSQVIRTISRNLVFKLLQRYHDACCEYLSSLRPDVIHVVTPDPGAVMLIRAAHTVGIPVVYQEVGIPFDPPGFEKVYERLAAVLFLCAEVAALSPRLAQEMSRLLPHLERMRVLPLISEGVPGVAAGSEAQTSSGCFGFAARLEHLKGPLPFVEASALACRARPGMSFKIAGDGSQRGLLIARIERLKLEKVCQLVGVYATARERSLFMQSIDVFVLPSLTEGTPNSIIEAMAHGKPVIATGVGGIPDIVTDEVGVLVPAGDTKALGDAMSRLAGDPELRRRMGHAARGKYEQLFTSRAVLPVITDLYEKAIGDGKFTPRAQAKGPNRLSHPWVLAAQAGTV